MRNKTGKKTSFFVNSICQRTIDDVLREQIGKTCDVYIDNVIIFSENEYDHVELLKSLCEANMKVSREKTKFFKESVEYFGIMVTRYGSKSDLEKVKAIQEISVPKNLFGLKSFLSLANYYRSFIKDFAQTESPSLNAKMVQFANICRERS